MNNWYGKEERTVETVSDTASWHSAGFLPAVPLRWVLIRDPQGKFKIQALLCTDLAADLEQITSWFVRCLSDGNHLPRCNLSAWDSRHRGIGPKVLSRGPSVR